MIEREADKRHRVCPKTGRPVGQGRRHRWVPWVFPLVGLVSLLWFLIRVIPKPSRATYPCQRFAAPFAGGFVVWLAGLAGSLLAYRKARRLMARSCYVCAAVLLSLAVVAIAGGGTSGPLSPLRLAGCWGLMPLSPLMVSYRCLVFNMEDPTLGGVFFPAGMAYGIWLVSLIIHSVIAVVSWWMALGQFDRFLHENREGR